jgi:hypothetical protein
MPCVHPNVRINPIVITAWTGSAAPGIMRCARNAG